ncbi:hypothetical protein ACLH0K_16450 [Arthrobacter sp. MPF02]|uniref:hypothetical protein n=1 Tax=Arthrobacter sp. MPF02 TaxID=3388492 RepID=UPI003984B2BE
MVFRIRERVLNCADPEPLARFWCGVLGDESWHVLAGPEGNEFCLLRRLLEQ